MTIQPTAVPDTAGSGGILSPLDTDTPRPPLPRSKILRGKIETWRSATAQYPKLHINLACGGLERANQLEHEVFKNAYHLCGKHPSTEWVSLQAIRPCRMCALESVLYTVLRGRKDETPSFATFSSQPVPNAAGTRLDRYTWSVASDSGQERLRRLAKRFALPTARSTAGLVAYGFLPPSGLDILETNLRTFRLPAVSALPAQAVVEAFWTLENDAPEQLGGGQLDPWETAELLCR